MRGQLRTPAQIVARIASGQHGVITFSQLLQAGLSSQAVDRWVAKGLLHRVHRGVYRLGHRAPSIQASYMAAVVATGPGSYLAGLAAAHVYGLIKGAAPPPETMSPASRRHPNITHHRVKNFHPLDTTKRNGIPITTVPRTIVDLAATLSLDDLALAVHNADVRYRTQPHQIEAALLRRRSTPGTSNLRLIVTGDTALLLSRLEREFRKLLRNHDLPLPRTNRKNGAHYVDCRWPGLRLTVELDSYRFHRTRHAWEADHQRTRAARARGDEFRRYTWRDVVEEPEPTLAELRPLLRA